MYRMSHFIISRFNTYMFYQIKRRALLEFIPLIDVSISIGTVASRVFLSDQDVSCCINYSGIKSRECVVSVYPLHLYSESCIQWWHTQTRMKMRELTLREKKAIWMLKEKRKSIRATANTKGMEKSRVCKPPATNNDLIGWENNGSWLQTNHKSSWKWTLKDVSVKSPSTPESWGDLWQSTVLRRLWHRITDATEQDANLWPAPKIAMARLELAKKHKGEPKEFWNCVYGPMRQRWTYI